MVNAHTEVLHPAMEVDHFECDHTKTERTVKVGGSDEEDG
jgi:hypothetical protein